MFESLFILDGKFHEQGGDVAIDSSLGPTIADVFMFHFEKNHWKNILLISKQLLQDDSLMIHFYSFEQRIMLKSLNNISTNKIKT